MTTRLEATVDLNLTQARIQLDRFENDLRQLRTPIDVQVEVSGEQQIAEVRREIDRASGVVDIDVDTQGLSRGEQVTAELNQEIAETRELLGAAQTRADDLGRELRQTGDQGATAFGRIRQTLGPLIATIAAGVGIQEIVQQLNAAVTAASSLEQSIGGVQAIFGEAADDVLAFGQNAAQVVGLSTSAANALAVQLGGQLQSYGFSAAEAADETARLITLGADLAATVGGPVSQAVEAVGSLLRGETNPIEQYGVSMNVAAIEAHALEQGIIGAGEQLTIQTKALAALDLLFRQTGGAQGQFARESETTAGQLERMRAEFANVQAELGEALVPAFKSGVETVRELLPLLADLGPAFGAVGNLAGDAVGNIAPFIVLLGEAAGAAASLGGAIGDLPVDIPLLGGGLASLGTISQAFFDLRDAATIGTNQARLSEFLESVAEAAAEGKDPVQILAASFEQLRDQGVDASRVVGQVADAATVSDLQFAAFLRSTIAEAEALGLTADEAERLRIVLRSMPESLEFGARGGIDPNTVADIQALAESLGISRVALDEFRGSADLAFDAIQGDVALRDAFGDIPLVVSDIDVLLEALDRGGLAIGNFLTDAPEDVGIIGVFDDVETAVLETMATLETLPDELRAVADGFKSAFDVDVNAETGKISADTEAFKNDVIADFQEVTDFEFDLSQIAITGEAPNVAEFLREQGLSASELAEALLGNPADLAAAEEALSGSAEALAGSTAEDYAGFLRDLTPEQVASLGVFARENFVSPAILNQIADSAEGLMQALEDALSGTTLTPDFILSLTGAEIVGLPSFTAPVNIPDPINVPSGGGGGGGGTGTPPGVTQQFQIVSNINNPQTVDVSTAGAQATQNNMAIVGLLTNRPN